MKRNVACSLQELSLQLGWMCGAEKALSVPFISALFLGVESDFTFAGVFSPQEYGRHLYSLLSAVVSSSRDRIAFVVNVIVVSLSFFYLLF